MMEVFAKNTAWIMPEPSLLIGGRFGHMADFKLLHLSAGELLLDSCHGESFRYISIDTNSCDIIRRHIFYSWPYSESYRHFHSEIDHLSPNLGKKKENDKTYNSESSLVVTDPNY